MKKAWIIALSLLSFTVCGSAQVFGPSRRSSAQAGINTAGAPIPDPLLKGKRAFISFEMGDVTAFPSKYSGGPERAYDELYAQMKQWGRYELVSDPKQADVVFAIRFVDPPNINPQIRLGVSDAKTGVSLWGFVEQVNFAFLKKNRDADFSDTVMLLVTDLKTLLTSATGQQP